MCLLHFPFLAFFTRFGRWTSVFFVFFSSPRQSLELNFFFVLPAQVEIGAFVFISSSPPQTFSLFYYHAILRGVEAPWKPGEVGFFAGRLAPRSSLYPREEKQPMCIPVFFPFSSRYISVCLCAHNKQNLLSIFTSPNNGICADELAGRAERFGSDPLLFLRAICALKRFLFLAVRTRFWHVQTIIPHVLFISCWQERLGFLVY